MSLLQQLQRRIAELVARAPKGYETVDAEGRPVIQSELPALQWYVASLKLLQSRGREEEKRVLRSQLARSVSNPGGSRLHELVSACDAGPVEQPPVSAPRRSGHR